MDWGWLGRAVVVAALIAGGCDVDDDDGSGEIGRITVIGVDDDYIANVGGFGMFVDRPFNMAPLADAQTARELAMGACDSFSYGFGGGLPPIGIPGAVDAGPSLMLSTADGDWMTFTQEETDDGGLTYSGSAELDAAPWGAATDFRIDPGSSDVPAVTVPDAFTLSGRITVTSEDLLQTGAIDLVRGEPYTLEYAVDPPTTKDTAYLILSGQEVEELFICHLDPTATEATIPVDILDQLTGDIAGVELYTAREHMIELDHGPLRVDALSMTRWAAYF